MIIQILAPPSRSVYSMVFVRLGSTRRSPIGAPSRASPGGNPALQGDPILRGLRPIPICMGSQTSTVVHIIHSDN